MNGKNRIEEICLKVPEFRKLYNTRVRHYIIEDHTINVYNQFVKYFSQSFPKNKIEEFTLFLLLHDIGKPISYNNGNRQNQFKDSLKEIDNYKEQLSISEDSFLLYTAILNSSSIGSYMLNKSTLEDMFTLIKDQAAILKIDIKEYFYLVSVYYQCDIASYTKDAGGLPYLEHLFKYQNGQKVCDKNSKLLVFSSVFKERYDQLKEKILEYSKSITSNQIIRDAKIKNHINLKVIGKIDVSIFEKTKKEIKSDKENIYIVDTNVFVDYPDIISKIDKKHPIVLSAKVVDELDHLKSKLDKNGIVNVQKVLKSLNMNMDTRNLRMEVSNSALLPNDFNKRSPDNLILSVALKFKTENPIILTSDNGLQLKAKGLGITTISLKKFINQLRRK